MVWIEWGVTNEVNGTEMNANEMVSCGGAGRAALPSAMPSPVSRLASSEPNMANAWRFQFWTNEYDSAWAFSWGKLRFDLGDAIERGLDGLPPGANEAAYCWIEIRPRWNSWIEFYGDELPTGAQIPPGTTRVFETEYTPLEPSDEENDVVATATFWHHVKTGNYWSIDSVTSAERVREWSDGEMAWNIPIGWREPCENGDWPRGVLHCAFRGLGLTVIKPQDKYKQTYTLNSQGESGVSKHGHSIVRTTNDVIRLDGVVVHEGCDK